MMIPQQRRACLRHTRRPASVMRFSVETPGYESNNGIWVRLVPLVRKTPRLRFGDVGCVRLCQAVMKTAGYGFALTKQW
ncbi:hypothetical protein Y032_0033g2636 [Ancylostoma ceylanicum]|uniref:Uncharacterized protein n=1 Tax=Ancylostoma ceylanicum TaxID=53326 RepID=A0A016ULY3_9BILA|nr:hypothetical protein Y032_0033g2636 [Ancylostoma ceylanicum]